MNHDIVVGFLPTRVLCYAGSIFLQQQQSIHLSDKEDETTKHVIDRIQMSSIISHQVFHLWFVSSVMWDCISHMDDQYLSIT